MKLRSLICVSAVAAASAAFALDGANTFARLKVTSDLSNSIIAIPLAGCGETEAKIYVTNLVMTTGLSTGDTLMYNDGTDWYAWEIKAGAWSPVASGTKNGVTVAAPNAYKMDCGKACWLVRSSTSNPIYLYGQVNETLPTSVTVGGATGGNQFGYTIIAKPSESSALDLSEWTPANAVTGDVLLVPTSANAKGQVTYQWDGSKWTEATQTVTEKKNPRTGQMSYVTNTTWTATSATIPAGKGFMYGRKATGTATLAW